MPTTATPQPPAGVPRAVGAELAPVVPGGAGRWLRAEGLAALAAAATLYGATGRGWGLFALLFLAPDVSIAAYAAGPRVGAAVYNALHSYVGPLALALGAYTAGGRGALPFACIWAAHIGFDRLLGYGLKYPSGFGDTHLGRTGLQSRALRR